MDGWTFSQVRHLRGVVVSRIYIPTGTSLGLAYGVDWQGQSIVIADDGVETRIVAEQLDHGCAVTAVPWDGGELVVIARGEEADRIASRWPAPQAAQGVTE